MYFRRTISPKHPVPLKVVYHDRLELDCKTGIATLDGTAYTASVGSWMFYLPAIEAKLFHATGGTLDCMHAARPDAAALSDPARPMGRYTAADWRRALETPVTRRLAEIWLASARLWKAGLGPQPLGVCFVDAVVRDNGAVGPTCGVLIQNVATLPRKLSCKREQLEAAGVVPDQILSCVRQQMRGYVVDLCSVVGCQPVNAEADVARLEGLVREGSPSAELQQALEETL